MIKELDWMEGGIGKEGVAEGRAKVAEEAVEVPSRVETLGGKVVEKEKKGRSIRDYNGSKGRSRPEWAVQGDRKVLS